MNRSEIVGLSSDLDGVDEFFQVGCEYHPTVRRLGSKH